MSRTTKTDGIRIPKYRRHVSGRAFVQLNGRRIYLGKHGSAESRERYERTIAEWLAGGRQALPKRADDTDGSPTVDEVLAEYWLREATVRYVKDGKPTSQLPIVKLALRPLRKLYGETPANEFGPRKLEVVRDEMIRAGLARKEVNRRVAVIRRVFRWAVAREMIRADVRYRLDALENLQRGRSAAHETEPVRPVEWPDVEAVLPHLAPHPRAMALAQWWSGMRPGEVCRMRMKDVDRTAKVWLYRPQHHKTEHFGRERVVPLGPKAQEVLAPFLKLDPEAFLFSPAESETARKVELRRRRKTRVQPSQVERARLARARGREKHGDFYTTAVYRRAIERACRRAGVEVWTPNRLRHAAATRLRRELGIDAARVVLGHASATVTEIYAEVDRAKAIEAMGRLG